MVAKAFDIHFTGENSETVKVENNRPQDSSALDHVDYLAEKNKRIKKDIRLDAVLSLVTAFEYEMPEKMSEQEYDSMSEWLDLLYWTLPPFWNVHFLINDLRQNKESVFVDQRSLILVVENHRKVVIGKSKDWTLSCNGRSNSGYYCGLWNLFHTISIGVAEQHMSVLGSKDRASTKHVARTLRKYIQYFFGNVESQSWKSDFITSYENCDFKVCTRFNSKSKVSKDEHYWRELTIYLWEVHNSINIKVMKEKAKELDRIPTKEDERKAIWPSNQACPACRKSNDKWDHGEVYLFIKNEYWPSGLYNLKYVVLDRKRKENDDRHFIHLNWSMLMFLIFFIAPGIGLVLFRKYQIFYSGQSKKQDIDRKR